MINKLKKCFGPKCTSLYVNSDFTGFINIPLKQMKFCEAVDQSFKVPLRLNAGNLGCPESRESGGIGENEIVVGLPFSIAEYLLHYYGD